MAQRDDVLVLVGHTPRSRRQVWINPFKVESIVEQPPLWSINGEYMTREEAKRRYQNVIDSRPKGDLVPTQINMDSGDQGIVRESVKEVMDRLQKAYQIDWAAPEQEETKDKDQEG